LALPTALSYKEFSFRRTRKKLRGFSSPSVHTTHALHHCLYVDKGEEPLRSIWGLEAALVCIFATVMKYLWQYDFIKKSHPVWEAKVQNTWCRI
jgi:hypothetical protein